MAAAVAYWVIFVSAGCKHYAAIETELSGGKNVVFKMPRLPRLGPLMVERWDKGKDAFGVVWIVNFDAARSGEVGPASTIEYGNAPKSFPVENMSNPEPIREGGLYSVSMDAGSVVAKGFFLVEKTAQGMRVRNLTYEEVDAFRRSNQKE